MYKPLVLITHPKMVEHQPGEGNLDAPERLEEVFEGIPLLREGFRAKEAKKRVPLGIDFAKKATMEQLLLFHTEDYISKIQELCSDMRANEIVELAPHHAVSRGTFEAASYAAGAAIRAAQFAQFNTKSFAIVRPPGHHAFADHGDGFCYFNNIVLATEFLRQRDRKVMIVDVDLHFGDGTQSYVEEANDVSYFSISHAHLWPFASVRSSKNSEHIYLGNGTGDEEYQDVLEDHLAQAVERFNPEIIAVSMGFDTSLHDYSEFRDVLGGGFQLTKKTYKKLWNILDATLVPYFAVLEGGYSPLGIIEGIESFLEKDE